MDRTAHTATLLGRISDFDGVVCPISQDDVHEIQHPVGFVDPSTGRLSRRHPIYGARQLITWIGDPGHRFYPHSRARVDVERLFDEIDAVRWTNLRTLPRNYHRETTRMLEEARAAMQHAAVQPPEDDRPPEVRYRTSMSSATYNADPRNPSWLRDYWLNHPYRPAQEGRLGIERPFDIFVGRRRRNDPRWHAFRLEMANRLDRGRPGYNGYVLNYWITHPILPRDTTETKDAYFRFMAQRVEEWGQYRELFHQQRREILGQS